MNRKSNKLHFNVGEYIKELEQINIRVNGKKVEKPVINEQTNLVNTDNETSNSSSLNNSLYIIFYLFFCLVFGFLYAGDIQVLI